MNKRGWKWSTPNKRKVNLPKEQLMILYEQGKTMEEIGRIFNTTKRVVHLRMQEYGIPRRKPIGENHGSWKGGEVIKSGYPAVYNPNHPRASKIGYVYTHVLIMEKMLGRIPKRSEPIHHIDFNRANFSESNLYLCRNHKEHKDLHCQMESLAKELFKIGIIHFKDGEYKFKENNLKDSQDPQWTQ